MRLAIKLEEYEKILIERERLSKVKMIVSQVKVKRINDARPRIFRWIMTEMIKIEEWSKIDWNREKIRENKNGVKNNK